MKKVLKIGLRISVLLFLCGVISVFGVAIYSLTALSVPLSTSKITENQLHIDIFNQQGLPLAENNVFSQPTTTYDKIPAHTINAFLSIEDKKFFSHNGVNFLRMGQAFLHNLKSFSMKEGASTITQQLIKNTHLSSHKTLPRKFNEIRLAIRLEKEMSKKDILTNYLNIIYFGNNCYGLQSASQFYFGQPTQKLTLDQSALLAGIIKSPNRYSPIAHPQNAIARRNVVLKEMHKDGIITKAECQSAQNQPLELCLNHPRKNKLNSYSQSALDEASQILQIPARQIALGKYQIHTFQDLDKQLKMNSLLENENIASDYAMININPTTGAVNAYEGRGNYKILQTPRQIGSTIKPILVYAPAFNENILSPASLILDEPITIGSYSPKNVSGNYAGYVTTRQALSKSLNIPAVKTASYVGLKKINNYAKALNLALDEKDMSYSMALGGLTYGFNLLQLCGAYTALANAGEYVQPHFVDYITNAQGQIVYRCQNTKRKVFRDDTSYLITDMLKTSAKTGTAKKLADLDFDVASKTGTVGGAKGNTDAYNISYTTQDIVGVWQGNLNNTLFSVAGGNQPTSLVKGYLKKIYNNAPPKPFTAPASVEKVKINQFELCVNHALVRAGMFTPEKDTTTELFSRFLLPKDAPIIAPKQINLVGYVENNKAVLKFTTNSSSTYTLYKRTPQKTYAIKTFANQNGQQTVFDQMLANQKCEYFVEVTNPTLATPTQSASVFLFSPANSPPAKWYI